MRCDDCETKLTPGQAHQLPYRQHVLALCSRCYELRNMRQLHRPLYQQASDPRVDRADTRGQPPARTFGRPL